MKENNILSNDELREKDALVKTEKSLSKLNQDVEILKIQNEKLKSKIEEILKKIK